MSTIDQKPAGWKVLHSPEVTEEVDLTGIRATMAFHGPWENRHEFLAFVAGFEEDVESPGGGTYPRRVPLKYPDDRYMDVYAVGIRMRGRGRSGSSDYGITYDWCEAIVQFKSQDYYVGQGGFPYVSIGWGGSGDIITVPNTAYEFPSDSLRLSQNAGVLIPKSDFTLTLHNLLDLDSRIPVWEGLVGRVSSTAFATPHGLFAAGKTQFLNYDTSSTLQIGNILIHQATLKFSNRWLEHNKIARPDGGGFEAPERVGSSDKLLPEGDLNGVYV